MEIVMLLAGLVVAVALAGNNLMGCLGVFAAFQFAATIFSTIFYVLAQSAVR